ncbi:MAG: hypothetical protein M1826_001584 [Phylliscum demangeonii]|nr:MAG: hypothetical protein M1826_001584 [Phylliscum demangeonii]
MGLTKAHAGANFANWINSVSERGEVCEMPEEAPPMVRLQRFVTAGQKAIVLANGSNAAETTGLKIESIVSGWFEEIHYLQVGDHATHLPEHLRDLLTIARTMREHASHLWSSANWQALSSHAISGSPKNGSWMEILCRPEELQEVVLPLLSGCLPRNALDGRHVFRADKLFQARFRSVAQDVFGDAWIDLVA